MKIAQGLYSFFLVFITALIAKYLTDQGLDVFYHSLEKPEISPEPIYFSYIWGLIYLLLFISFYIVLCAKSSIEDFKDANALFALQLLLQILWCFSFFYMEQLWASAIVIISLDIVVALMMHTFLRINGWSFLLLIPYLIWILFATYLNVFLIFLN